MATSHASLSKCLIVKPIVESSAIICLLCKEDIHRNVGNPTYTPRCKNSEDKCMVVSGCSSRKCSCVKRSITCAQHVIVEIAVKIKEKMG